MEAGGCLITTLRVSGQDLRSHMRHGWEDTRATANKQVEGKAGEYSPATCKEGGEMHGWGISPGHMVHGWQVLPNHMHTKHSRGLAGESMQT